MNRIYCAFLALGFMPSAFAADVHHVDANLTTGTNDGSSWADAFQGTGGLRLALFLANSGDRIYVAEGIYLPSATLDRTSSFKLMEGVELYGGFVGTEGHPAQRPPLGVADSVLSGDLAGNDGPQGGGRGENSYHVLRGDEPGQAAVLDGFVVSGGFANGGGNNANGAGLILFTGANPTIRNCEFRDNRADSYGGGIVVWGDASPRIHDCIFDKNKAGSRGGGICTIDSGALTIDRCRFTRCAAGDGGGMAINAQVAWIGNCIIERCSATGGIGGGGLFSWQSLLRVYNCTVVSNVSTGHPAAGMRTNLAAGSAVNCIVWGNVGPGGAQGSINQVDIQNDVQYSIITGGYPGIGNLSADPQFVDEASGNLALQAGSPAIDAGDNGALPAGILNDFSGAPRFTDSLTVADTGNGAAPVVDIGALEDQPATLQSLCHGDGTGAACPCEEFGVAGSGCSSGVFADGCQLLVAGTPSVSNDSLRFIATRSTPGAPGLLFQGSMVLGGGVGTPLGNGLLCFPSQMRWPTSFADASGTASYGPNLLGASSAVVPGSTLLYQWWYRDTAGACGAGFNFSNAWSVVWLP